MRAYFHLSLKSNLDSILIHGLLPQIGERSLELDEEAVVWLFATESDMNDALGQWLGEWYEDKYGEDVCLASFKILLPDNFSIYEGTAGYERFSKEIISPAYIHFHKDE